ncbi:nitroreductase/quinone reductase family protein [Actinokineospora sp. NBRC 105648]|uniref:nitroreductase/quinone reductase family protein n=1 Tax=Actinokineospora sp. NBRC 105648 TaxID=3032206 RepID=UPI0024A12470|nr:nitroreductase/quinone reductase family protein [Actinokineospora sp. NBRC 105648]GLZ39483.1 cation-binding protein [Actinokineospora sp. NBRC 105648]
MPNPFNDQVITEFRANQGRVGGYFEGARLILLTTTGARSGTPHTTPLGYLPDGGERVIVIGSAGGSPRHPDWYRNLLANPSATVEDGILTYDADATVLTGPERAEVWARAVEADPGWAAYQEKTTRELPVVALAGRLRLGGSLSATVKQLHDSFRRELAHIRADVSASGPRLGAQLRVNCLTICAGLGNHHTGEDANIFPWVASRYPEAAPLLERLSAEHVEMAAVLERLRAVLAGDQASVAVEVEELVGLLERHLDYEDANLLPLLD